MPKLAFEDGVNQHACALIIDKIGILITGKVGSGKTSLCLGLLERAKLIKSKATFVSDDQVLLTADNTSLFAASPESINGQVEIRGYGITTLPNQPFMEVSLIVELVDDATIDRMPEPAHINIQGIEIPHLRAPTRNESQAVRIVFAWLNDNTDLKFF